MNRTTKKCIIASMGLHSLLVLILFVGPAFFSREKKTEKYEVIELVGDVANYKTTDGQTHGGSRNASVPAEQPPQAPPQEQQQAAPPPPQRDPTPPQRDPEPAPAPEPPKVREVSKPEPADDPEPVKVVKKVELKSIAPKATKSTSKLPTLDLKPTVRTGATTTRPNQTASRTTSNTSSQSKIWRELANSVGGASKNIKERTGGSTSIEMPGTGEGGEVYVNYAQLVISAYDRAWHDPDDVSDENATVKTEIVVARDGRIISARVIGRSGIAALDKSVDSALTRVTRLPAFPEGSSDRQRTFIIRFNLKSKRALG